MLADVEVDEAGHY